jgi:hypothetical protein
MPSQGKEPSELLRDNKEHYTTLFPENKNVFKVKYPCFDGR